MRSMARRALEGTFFIQGEGWWNVHLLGRNTAHLMTGIIAYIAAGIANGCVMAGNTHLP